MSWHNPNFQNKNGYKYETNDNVEEKNNANKVNDIKDEVKQEFEKMIPLDSILNTDSNISNNKLKFKEYCEYPNFATITGAPRINSMGPFDVGKLTNNYDGKYLGQSYK